MGFDDLENAANDQDKTSGTSETSQSSSESQTSEESYDPLKMPAFEFASVKRRSIYAREESWEKFEDGRDLEMTRALRDADVRNHESREVHDAMIRLAAENPERLAELVLEARGIEQD